MRYKKSLIIFSLLIMVISGGCSKDTNKAELDKEMFEEGKQVVKLYAQTYNGEDKGSEASEASQAFLKKYGEDAESKLPVNELFFVQTIELLHIKYLTYGLRKTIDEMNGSSESDEIKEEIRDLLLQIKEEFGISLE